MGSEEPLGHARRFQEPAVYENSRLLARGVFQASKGCPREEAYSITDQVRRALHSVGAQIAEAWAKRHSPEHFISKQTDADGEQLETQHWLTEAYDCEYLSKSDTHRLGSLCLEGGRMLGERISKADQFRQPEDDQLQESPSEYHVAELPTFLRACLKMARGAGFVQEAGWRGATRERVPVGQASSLSRSTEWKAHRLVPSEREERSNGSTVFRRIQDRQDACPTESFRLTGH